MRLRSIKARKVQVLRTPWFNRYSVEELRYLAASRKKTAAFWAGFPETCNGKRRPLPREVELRRLAAAWDGYDGHEVSGAIPMDSRE